MPATPSVFRTPRVRSPTSVHAPAYRYPRPYLHGWPGTPCRPTFSVRRQAPLCLGAWHGCGCEVLVPEVLRRLAHRFALLISGASSPTRRVLAVLQIAVLRFSVAVPPGTA